MPANPNDPASSRAEFLRRVGLAIDFIDSSEARDLTTEEIARVSGISVSYLDRVLFDCSGQTATQRVLDHKLDKAARILASGKGRSVSDVSGECGFASKSEFSRYFAKKFGVRPSKWRGIRDTQGRSAPELPREGIRDDAGPVLPPSIADDGTPTWSLKHGPFENVVVRIEEMNDMELACIRFIGPYPGIGKAFRLLHCWAHEHSLMTPEAQLLGVYHDIPEVTAPEDLRSDACMTVPPGTRPSVPVTIRSLASRGSYACGYFEFKDARLFPVAWKAMTAVWLPSSGYQFDDRPTFEMYRGDHLMLDDTFRIEICLPVRPL